MFSSFPFLLHNNYFKMSAFSLPLHLQKIISLPFNQVYKNIRNKCPQLFTTWPVHLTSSVPNFLLFISKEKRKDSTSVLHTTYPNSFLTFQILSFMYIPVSFSTSFSPLDFPDIFNTFNSLPVNNLEQLFLLPLSSCFIFQLCLPSP